MVTGELHYLDLLRNALTRGTLRETRAVLRSTGERVRAYTLWAPDPLRFDLARGFPAVTTKRLAWRSVVAELLWFLSGSTDERELRAMGATIWQAWADPETGEVGPSYGHNWRRFGGHTDQVAALVEGIRATVRDPGASVGRRLMLTALDPATVHEAALYPCHPLAQWDVHDGQLSCAFYQRSADLFLGTPFNVASYALLTHLLAAVCGLTPGTLTMHLGNAHVYENHADLVREQLRRWPRPSPRLNLPAPLDFQRPHEHARVPVFCGPEGLPLTVADLGLLDYDPHPALAGEVAV
jgi:thymidylate synthase